MIIMSHKSIPGRFAIYDAGGERIISDAYGKGYKSHDSALRVKEYLMSSQRMVEKEGEKFFQQYPETRAFIVDYIEQNKKQMSTRHFGYKEIQPLLKDKFGIDVPGKYIALFYEPIYKIRREMDRRKLRHKPYGIGKEAERGNWEEDFKELKKY